MLIDKMNDKLQSLTLEDSSIRISDAKAVMSSTFFYIKTHFSHAAAGKLVGIDLVSEEVNKKTGGARRKEFTVIGGRPGMSKSGTCLNILEKNSMVLGKRGLVFSFEMSEEVCGERLIAQRLGTNLNNLHTGFFSKPEMTRIFRPVACKDCGGTELSQVVNYKESDGDGCLSLLFFLSSSKRIKIIVFTVRTVS